MLGDFIHQLYQQHGPQGWWPRLVGHPRASSRHPRESGDPAIVQHHATEQAQWLLQGPDLEIWEVVLGAVLTQNTNWNNVEKALLNLAQADLLHPEKIRDANPERLEQTIRPAGYFRQKTKALKNLVETPPPPFPSSSRKRGSSLDAVRGHWLSQWGVGPETADTILLYGYNLPIFVVDAYTRRLLTHLTTDQSWLKKPYDDVRIYCEAEVPGGVEEWQEAHALIVRWGKEK